MGRIIPALISLLALVIAVIVLLHRQNRTQPQQFGPPPGQTPATTRPSRAARQGLGAARR